jgi:lipopolysaccharide transport system ATP-binding protein
MKADIVIRAEGLGKRYERSLGSHKHNSIRDTLAARIGALIRGGWRESASRDTFWALRDASFDIARGENVGIIGLNGAGKSTLLKILSRITTPTVGYARVTGRLGALLEVGTGFHSELTGRENTFLYGAILGMSRAEVARKFDAIVDFSEIADFIDTPVKRYSSGMYVRLAFAVAAHLDPDILLLDEVLAVGDVTFQRKCMDFARQLEQKGSTILFVSHNMFSIKTMCQRVIYLKRGRIFFDGPTDKGLQLFEADSKLGPAPWFNPPKVPSLIVTNVELYGEHGELRTMFDFGERMRIRICYRAFRPIQRPHFLCSIKRSDQILCCNFSSSYDHFDVPRISGDGAIELLTPPLKVISDRYHVTIAVCENDQQLIAGQLGSSFHVRHESLQSSQFGVFHESAQWRIERGTAAHAELGDEHQGVCHSVSDD